MPITARAPGSAPGIIRLCIVAALAGVLYGSWLPLDFELQALEAGPAALLGQLDFSRPHLEDAVTNVLVYVPIGLFLGWRALLIGGGPWAFLLLPLGICGVTSGLGEAGQLLLPLRDPSYTDMLFNAGGTLLGLLLAVPCWRLLRAARTILRHTLARRPMRALLWLAVAIVIFAKLAPFDLAVAPGAFENSLREARWDPLAGPQRSPQDTFLEDMTDVAGAFFAFVLLGILAAMAHRESGDSRGWSAVTASIQLGFLAVGIEVLQLLIVSHTCDAGDMVTYWAGAVVGALLGATVIDRSWQQRTAGQGAGPALRCLLSIALMVQVSMIAAYALPAGQRWVAPSLDSIQWLPFYAHFCEPFAVGVGRIISSTMWYLVLAVLAVSLVPSHSAAYSLAMSAFLTVGVVTTTEVIQAFSISRYADVTEPLLALLAACVATAAFRRLRRWYLEQPAEGAACV